MFEVGDLDAASPQLNKFSLASTPPDTHKSVSGFSVAKLSQPRRVVARNIIFLSLSAANAAHLPTIKLRERLTELYNLIALSHDGDC
jgi:hypothetical protein